MPSKTVEKFQSENLQVSASAQEMAGEVAEALALRFNAYLAEGEKAVDWGLAQQLISRMLAGKGQELDGLDSQLEVDRTAIKKLRIERDSFAGELRRGLRSARFLLDESFGREQSAGLFRRRDLSRVKPGALVRLARETATSLRSPQLALTRQAATGDLPEPGPLADTLERRARDLEQQLELLAPKSKRETFAVGQKSQEWQEALAARQRAQDMLFGLYRGAGLDHLAARLRPKRRRKEENPEAGGKPAESPKMTDNNNQEGGKSPVGIAPTAESPAEIAPA